MSADIQAILDERQQTHGDFTDNARVMQELKEVCRGAPNWGRLTPVQREGLDMIMHKVGRILSGNPDYPDHWDDIQGYARCVSERLEKRKSA